MKDTIFIIDLIFFLAITNVRAATMFMIQTTQLLLTYDKMASFSEMPCM